MKVGFDIDDALAFRPVAEIRREQERLLNEHLEHCRLNSPYYRDIPAKRFTLESLPELPTMATKAPGITGRPSARSLPKNTV